MKSKKSTKPHLLQRFTTSTNLKKIVGLTAASIGVFVLTLFLLNQFEAMQVSNNIHEIPQELQQLPPVAYSLNLDVPQVSAKNVYIFDPIALSVLYEKDSDTPVPPASTTKLMTALVALNTFQLSDTVSLPAARLVVGSSSKIASTTTWSVEQLLHALLVSSGNDAAIALAQSHAYGYDAFVNDMNKTALEIGLDKTHFNNVSGLDSPGHHSSARDLAFLTMEVMRHPLLRQIVSAPSVTIQDVSGSIGATLYSTNVLLSSEPGVVGVKTGKTEAALECLITWIERDNHPVLIVMLGSTDRFGETKTLIDWVYANFEWIQV
jgi:D-alanyl-D-alanine carboxypeptidase (penicillin-binding protein 5/6)